MSEIPKPIASELGGEFLAYLPDKDYAKKEEEGQTGWTEGSNLPFIESSRPRVLDKPIEPIIENLLKALWHKGQVHTNLPQRNFLAQTRAPNPAAPKQAPTPKPPLWSVSPTTLAAATPGLTPQDTQYLKGIARDWEGMLRFKRVTAFTFRGDYKRTPADIKKAGGFHPPSTRDDDAFLHGRVYNAFADYMTRRGQKQPSLDDFKAALAKQVSDPNTKALFLEYSIWRWLLGREELHVGRMLANELLKGYISTSKSVRISKGFARMGEPGYVYCLLVQGAYEVPAKGKDEWTKIFGEQEVAFPGAVSWENVQGWRQVDKSSGKFAGNVFLRNSFSTFDKGAAEKVYKYLCGKIQKTEDS